MNANDFLRERRFSVGKNKIVDFDILDGSTRCETAYLTVKCYVETEPEVGICGFHFTLILSLTSNQMLIQLIFHSRVPNYHNTIQNISFTQCPNTNCSNVICTLKFTNLIFNEHELKFIMNK